MTYSIVARDAETGEIGVAVQTALPGVGILCPWAEAGVGAVATQSLVRVSHGPSGLSLMRNGHTAPEALAAVLAGDEGREVRQIGMIDANGNVDAHTGKGCIRYAGQRIGENYAVQANMMADETVPKAMAMAFENTTGPLVRRMVAALHAAQAEGGDFRGQQSAALKIVSGDVQANTWEGVLYDLRVDDHAQPVEELARLGERFLARNLMGEAYQLAAKGDFDAAMKKYDEVISIDPDEKQLRFSFALTLATNHGQLERAAPVLRALFAEDRMWVEYVRRLGDARLAGQPEMLEKVLALAE